MVPPQAEEAVIGNQTRRCELDFIVEISLSNMRWSSSTADLVVFGWNTNSSKVSFYTSKLALLQLF